MTRMEDVILNLTIHEATEDQELDGVVEPNPTDKEQIKKLLNFSNLPSRGEIEKRAFSLADLAKKEGVNFAMIGGAPYLMAELEVALHREGITPLYAFSIRESVEETTDDGSVVKKNVFRHQGFIIK